MIVAKQIPPLFIKDIERISKKINMSGDCWLWEGHVGQNGYGQVGIRDAVYQAHRVVYFIVKGSIDTHKYIDHLCRKRSCVNPKHLEEVTHADNVARGINHWRDRSACSRNHQYTTRNTLIRYRIAASGNMTRSRVCKICANERRKKWSSKP